jgi:hypothetical protein
MVLKMTVTVKYDAPRTPVDTLKDNLRGIIDRAYRDGSLSEDTSAEVEAVNVTVDLVEKKKSKVTYEIQGYISESAFEQYLPLPLESGYLRKETALRDGKKFLEMYPIVKVQSSDREFIEVLRR